MKKSPFREYIDRLMHQTWLLITGGVGFIVTLLVEVFFQNTYVVVVYISIFVCSLIIGGYFAFVDLLKDYWSLESRLQEIENRKPDISVGFQNSRGGLVKELKLILCQLPSKPDFDILVEEKQIELLAKSPSYGGINRLATSMIFPANRNYDEEVEEYLKKYRTYLFQRYECTLDRSFAIHPIIQNNGQYPANNITVEFIMPPQFVTPSEHHCFDRASTDFEEIEFYLVKPTEPKLFIDHSAVLLAAMCNVNPIISQYAGRSNTRGPKYEEKNGRIHIVYSVDKLVQHNPEDDFDPFWLWLGNIDENLLWELSVRIISSDLRQPETDTLYLDMKILKDE